MRNLPIDILEEAALLARERDRNTFLALQIKDDNSKDKGVLLITFHRVTPANKRLYSITGTHLALAVSHHTYTTKTSG